MWGPRHAPRPAQMLSLTSHGLTRTTRLSVPCLGCKLYKRIPFVSHRRICGEPVEDVATRGRQARGTTQYHCGTGRT